MAHFMPEIVFHNVEGVHAMGHSFFFELNDGLTQFVVQHLVGIYGQNIGVFAQGGGILALYSVAGESTLVYLASGFAANVRSSVGAAGVHDYDFIGYAFKGFQATLDYGGLVVCYDGRRNMGAGYLLGFVLGDGGSLVHRSCFLYLQR